VQDKSARESLQTFAAGKGDVLLAYENEAITAQQQGIELDYVIPDQTILIQNPIAVTSESEHQEQARAFVSWLRTDEAQRIFADHGYRSVKEQLVDEKTYPTPASLFKIDKVGGWDAVNARMFDPDTGSVAKIQEDLGVSTAG
jgi:sulfate transport system substrate-binding protein